MDMSFSRIPDPGRSFHRSHDFQTARDKFLHNETLALILEGVSGTGKSEIAYQLACDFKESVPRRKLLTCMLNSSSVPALLNGMVDLCKERNLDVRVESPHSFEDIYACLNEAPFDDYIKVFLFDDMIQDDDQDILNCTVLAALRCLNREEDRDKKDKWKFIVTAQHKTGKVSEDFRPALAILPVAGFTLNDTLQFAKQGHDDRLKVSDGKIKALHDKLMGSPLGLSIALRDLDGQGDKEFATYIQALEERAQKLLKDSRNDSNRKAKNIIASIAMSLEKLFAVSTMQYDMLRIISFFHENNMTHAMLVACMEICEPGMSFEGISHNVIAFLKALKDRQFDSVKITGEHGLDGSDRLSIHQLVMTALRSLCHKTDSIETRKSSCRKALTALVRVMDIDGRFAENHETNSNHVQHALTLLKIMEKEKTDFCDVTMKMLHAQILAAVGYIYLRGRNFVEEGRTKLLSARDALISSYNELVNPGVPEENQTSEIGLKLYGRMSQLVEGELGEGEHYPQHVADVPIYRRLTQRDCTTLGVEHGDLKHIKDNDELEDLRHKRKALPQDVMVRIYAIELAASIICVLARLASFHAEVPGMNREAVLTDSIKNAQIARSMYNQIKEHHGINILNNIIVHREELHFRMELIESGAHNDGRDVEWLNAIIQEAKDLQQLTDPAYEFGLLRSILREDNYHYILCNEIRMRACGLLYRLDGSVEHLQLAKGLFDGCMQRAKKEINKSDCLSNVHHYYAKFLSNCGQSDQAVHSVIDSIRLLIEDGNKVVIDKLKKGRFLELCSDLKNFAHGRKLSEEDEKYIRTLVRKCDQHELKDRADTLRCIFQSEQPMDVDSPVQQSEFGVLATDGDQTQ